VTAGRSSALARLGRIGLYATAVFLSLFVLAPIYLMTLAAFSSDRW